MKAIITYKPDSQKIPGSIRDSLTTDVLTDICYRVTQQRNYVVREDSSTYNKGRLVIVEYKGRRSYVTLSERKYEGRNRIGDKQCALCGCPVEEIVQGAHIWNVADIRRSNLQESEKFKAATNGNNGIWLCQNHHKLFDSNLIMIDHYGSVRLSSNLDDNDIAFVKGITSETHIEKPIMSDEFIQYLDLRNTSVDIRHSIAI